MNYLKFMFSNQNEESISIQRVKAYLISLNTNVQYSTPKNKRMNFALTFSRTLELLDFLCSGIQFYVLLSPYLCFFFFFIS